MIFNPVRRHNRPGSGKVSNPICIQSLREHHARLRRIATKQNGGVAYASNKLAIRSLCERLKRRIARITFHSADANFNQFVIAEGTGRLGDDRITCAALPDRNNRLQRVAETSQVAALFFSQTHSSVEGTKRANQG
jgi:predicted RNA polymerase sigma factor